MSFFRKLISVITGISVWIFVLFEVVTLFLLILPSQMNAEAAIQSVPFVQWTMTDFGLEVFGLIVIAIAFICACICALFIAINIGDW